MNKQLCIKTRELYNNNNLLLMSWNTAQYSHDEMEIASDICRFWIKHLKGPYHEDFAGFGVVRPGCSIATGDGSVTPVGERRVKDIICISAMMRSRYFAITLNSTPQNLAWPLKYNCTYVWIHYCYVTVFSNGHRPLLYCGQLLDVSWGLNFFFTLSKIMWKIMKWYYKHLAHEK